MYGAILGDIIGSPFEFDRGDKTKNFDLFSEGCGFTDDSVMTIAVGEALLAVGPEAAVKKIEDAVASNMQDWGKRYPHAGYGGCFRHWLKENNPKPYGSYGNGSAMRYKGCRVNCKCNIYGKEWIFKRRNQSLYREGISL